LARECLGWARVCSNGGVFALASRYRLSFVARFALIALRIVSKLTPGSQADRAGLRENDFIASIDGESMANTPLDRILDILKVRAPQMLSRSCCFSTQPSKFFFWSFSCSLGGLPGTF
jgi:hypothetical protein